MDDRCFAGWRVVAGVESVFLTCQLEEKVDAVPNQHLSHQCLGLRKDAIQPTQLELLKD